MLEQIKQTAERMRGLREIEGISTESLSKDLGISKDVYESYESGEVDIPMSFLYEFANKFGVELTAIISGDDPRLTVYQLVRAGEGLDVQRRKEYKYQNLAFNFKHKRAEIFTVEVPESNMDDDAPENAHPGHEFNYVLEGTLKLTINGTEITMQPGDALYFDAKYKQGMQAVGGKAKFLAIIF